MTDAPSAALPTAAPATAGSLATAGSAAAEPRRGRPGYDRRGALEVAARVFNEHGYDATSMGMLATRLGLSKSAIYHHFASKEQVLDAALDEALGGLEQVLDEPGAATGEATDRLTYVVRRAVEVLVERLPYVTLLLRLRGNTEVERRALARRRRFDDAVSALVHEAQEQGAVRGDLDPAIATRLVFGMVNSLVEWYRPTGPEGARQQAGGLGRSPIEGARQQAGGLGRSPIEGARQQAGGLGRSPILGTSDIADDVLALVFDGLRRR